MIDLEALFDNDGDDEYLQFDRVKNPLHPRPDICAFILLDRLVPNPGRDMVTEESHGEIYLDTDCGELAKVATEADILTLRRCGVRYDGEFDCLAMSV